MILYMIELLHYNNLFISTQTAYNGTYIADLCKTIPGDIEIAKRVSGDILYNYSTFESIYIFSVHSVQYFCFNLRLLQVLQMTYMGLEVS